MFRPVGYGPAHNFLISASCLPPSVTYHMHAWVMTPQAPAAAVLVTIQQRGTAHQLGRSSSSDSPASRNEGSSACCLRRAAPSPSAPTDQHLLAPLRPSSAQPALCSWPLACAGWWLVGLGALLAKC